MILSDEHSQRILHLDRSVVPRRVRVIQGEDDRIPDFCSGSCRGFLGRFFRGHEMLGSGRTKVNDIK